VATVALAGCTSGGPDTTTPTETPVDPGGSDELSVQAADDRLRAAGSFTTDWSYTVTDVDGTTTSVNDTYRVDLENDRSYERLSTAGPAAETTVETYVAGGTSYNRVGASGDAYYQTSDQPPNVFETATGRASGFYSDFEEDATFVGTETFDGDTVSRYEYSDADAWGSYNNALRSAAFSSSSNVTITEFEVAILVDGDGVGRLTTFTVSGETDDGTQVSAEWRYSVTDIGSTTVDEPDWLDEARAQT